MTHKYKITLFLLVFVVFTGCESAWGTLTIHSLTAVEIELTGYDGLLEISIFKGNLDAGSKGEINTSYRGLAILVFAGGQRYPVIIGDESFTLKVAAPGQSPSFIGSPENEFFYKSLSGDSIVSEHDNFVPLMFQAKDLLESSQSIHTVKELAVKKKDIQKFVSEHYEYLKHSDMIRRLVAQYFMMLEYVNYHTEGASATDMRGKYQKEVLNGVENWLNILQPYISKQEILNYCVSLYYNRSMVTLASKIIDKFKYLAYCPGDDKVKFKFTGSSLVKEASGGLERNLADFNGNKIIAFVSEECPVSMVATLSKVRQLADQKAGVFVIVVPMEKLSDNHMSMARMISSRNIFFINDEKWRKENLQKKIKLPLFLTIRDNPF